MPDQIDLFAGMDATPPETATEIVPVAEPVVAPVRCEAEGTSKDTAETLAREDPVQRQATVQELAGIVDEVYRLNHFAHDTFANVVELWKWVLRRHSFDGEKRYLEVVARMQPDAVRAAPKGFVLLLDHFVMRQHFSDLLGPVYMELASRWKQSGLGQYFTPWEVCLAMAIVTIADAAPTAEQPLTVNEPCVGSGAMLLACREAVARHCGREALRHLHVSGQDIDQVCVDMAEVQLLMTDDRFMRDWAMANMLTLPLKEQDDDEATGGATEG